MTLLADPMTSYWLTMLNPAGERVILIGFELYHIVWFFIALCVMAVAKILEKASILYEENKSKELADAIGITEQNLSLIKQGKIKGFRFSTLDALCKYLDCQPGDLFSYIPVKENDGD